MITFVPIPSLTRGPFVGVGDLNTVMGPEDVICFGYSPDPVHTISDNPWNQNGFIVAVFSGLTPAQIIDALRFAWAGQSSVATFWKKQETKPEMMAKKKEYTPSAWAEPVPLP